MVDSRGVGRPLSSYASAGRRLLSFTWGSGVGLALDLGIFSGLVALGVLPLVANLCSSAVAITTVYILVTRFAFQVSPSWRTYVAFVVWYATSATLVSFAIEVLSSGGGRAALLTKAAFVPVTFATNYLFGRWLFTGGAERVRGPKLVRRMRGSSRQPTDRRPEEEDFRIERLLARPRFRRRRLIVASAVTGAFVLLVLPFTTSVSFTSPPDRRGAVIEFGLRVLFTVALWVFVLFLLRFVTAVRLRSVRHRRWAMIAATSLAINAVVLLLIYPGFWVFDEFYTLTAARTYSTHAWQGYLTTVFYTFGLFGFPSALGILLLQLVVIALVVGYVISLLQDRLRRPALALLLAIPLLSPAVLLNNQYPLRLTMYAYLLVLLVARLLAVRRTVRPVADRAAVAFLGDCVLVAVLAFWRTEGLYLLLVIPLAFVLRGLHRSTGRARRTVVGLAAAGVTVVAATGGVTASTTDPTYQATAMMNPLSTMIHQPLGGPRIEEDLATIGTFVRMDMLRKWPKYEETPSYQVGALQPGPDPAWSAFRAAFVDVVVHNPGPFLENRWRAFIAANSMTEWRNQAQEGDPPNVYRVQSLSEFARTNFLVQPLDAPLKLQVELGLLGWNPDASKTPLAPLLWNAVPIIAALAVLLVIALVRRAFRWALAALALLANAALVFLTEPASYFMYFFPVYLAGSLLISAIVVLGLDRRRTVVLRRRAPERTIDAGVLPAPDRA